MAAPARPPTPQPASAPPVPVTQPQTQQKFPPTSPVAPGTSGMEPVAASGPQQIIGVMCPIESPYTGPDIVFGQNGFPRAERGPHVIAPGCGFGLPTMHFEGPWQPMPNPLG